MHLLSFAVPAMAADDFDATFSVDSISTSSDHNAEYMQPIVVTLTFGAKVDGTAVTPTILVEDKFGAQTPVTAPALGMKDIDRFTKVSRTIVKSLLLPSSKAQLALMT